MAAGGAAWCLPRSNCGLPNNKSWRTTCSKPAAPARDGGALAGAAGLECGPCRVRSGLGELFLGQAGGNLDVGIGGLDVGLAIPLDDHLARELDPVDGLVSLVQAFLRDFLAARLPRPDTGFNFAEQAGLLAEIELDVPM